MQYDIRNALVGLSLNFYLLTFPFLSKLFTAGVRWSELAVTHGQQHYFVSRQPYG